MLDSNFRKEDELKTAFDTEPEFRVKKVIIHGNAVVNTLVFKISTKSCERISALFYDLKHGRTSALLHASIRLRMHY